MNLIREHEAIKAYLKLLHIKGADDVMLQEHALFLQKLSVNLSNKQLNGGEYRLAIEAVMEQMPPDNWHANLTTAREFYAFWINDIKAIAAFNIQRGFVVDSTQWQPGSTSLKLLSDSVETQKFDTAEMWPLKAYTQALRHEGAEKTLVDTRVNLAKIILIRLKEAPVKNHQTYRSAVDLTLPLFTLKQNRRLFLVVVREFYHFWAGNPEARNMVLKDGSGNMLE